MTISARLSPTLHHARRAALVVLLAAVSPLACKNSTGSSPTQLMANVVNPQDVNAISLFNSCVGHAYPGPAAPNSAKNYFWPNSINFATNTALRLYAACDGTTAQPADDLSPDEVSRGQTMHLYCDNSSTALRYFHLVFDPGLVGKHVTAGSLLGTASMVGDGQSPAATWQNSSNFDIAVSDQDDSRTENYFAMLGASAFAAWAGRGITSVGQTAKPGNPSCPSYTSQVGDPDIPELAPAR